MSTTFGESATAGELGVKTASVASQLVVGQALTIFVSGLVFIILARLLGPSGYGIYALALAIAGFIGSLAGVGVGRYIDAYIPKYMAKGKHEEIRKMIGSVFFVLACIGIAASVIGLIFSGAIANAIFHGESNILLVRIAVFNIAFAILFGAEYSTIIAFGDGKAAMLAAVATAITQAGISIGLVMLGYGALGAVIGYVTGLIFGTVLQLVLILKQTKINIDFGDLKGRFNEIFSFALPLTGANIIQGVTSNFAVIFLGLLFLPSVVGVYSVASKIGTFIGILTGSISLVLVPMFSVAFEKKKIKSEVEKVYNYSMYFGFIFVIPLIIYVAALSRPFVQSLFGSSYIYAPFYMSLVSVSIVIQLVSIYGTAIASSLMAVKKVLKYAIISGTAQLVSLIILAPIMGALGAVIAIFFVGSIVSSALYFFYIKSELKLHASAKLRKLVLPTVITAVIFLALGLSGIYATYQLILGILLLVFAYPVILALTGAFTMEESALLRKASKDIPYLSAVLILLVSYSETFMR